TGYGRSGFAGRREIYFSSTGSSVGCANSASRNCRIRASTSSRFRPSFAYAFAAWRATSASRRPQAPASFHVVFNITCWILPGAAQTLSTSTASASCFATGGGSSSRLDRFPKKLGIGSLLRSDFMVAEDAVDAAEVEDYAEQADDGGPD